MAKVQVVEALPELKDFAKAIRFLADPEKVEAAAAYLEKIEAAIAENAALVTAVGQVDEIEGHLARARQKEAEAEATLVKARDEATQLRDDASSDIAKSWAELREARAKFEATREEVTGQIADASKAHDLRAAEVEDKAKAAAAAQAAAEKLHAEAAAAKATYERKLAAIAAAQAVG